MQRANETGDNAAGMNQGLPYASKLLELDEEITSQQKKAEELELRVDSIEGAIAEARKTRLAEYEGIHTELKTIRGSVDQLSALSARLEQKMPLSEVSKPESLCKFSL